MLKRLAAVGKFSRKEYARGHQVKSYRTEKRCSRAFSCEKVPRGQYFCHVILVAYPSIVPGVQLQGYKHHFYLSTYESKSILDRGNPAYTYDQHIRELCCFKFGPSNQPTETCK